MYFIFFLLLLIGNFAQAQPMLLNPNSHYENTDFIPFYEDPNANLSLEQIISFRNSDFKTIQAQNFNLGFTKSAFWFKIQLKNNSNFDDWLLAIKYPPLDSITVYYQDSSKNWQKIYLGDHFPFSSRQILYHEHLFALPLPDTLLHTFYVRVRSETTLLIPISVVRSTDFFIKETTTELINICLFSVLCVVSVYYFAMFIFTNDLSYLYCMLMILGNAINLFSLTGLLQRYFLGNNIWLCSNITPLSANLSSVGAVLFLHKFLELKKYGSFFSILYAIIFSIVILIFLFVFSGNYGLSVRTLHGLIFLGLVYALFSSAYVLKKNDLKARYVLVAFLIPILGSVVVGLKVFGILPANFWTTYTLNISFTGQLISIALAFADKQNLLKKQKETAEKEVLAAKELAIQELDTKVRERTSEIQVQKDILAEKSEALKEKNDKLIDGIRYAQSIQGTILPKESVFKQNFTDHFIIFKPKDIVSGDFYWFSDHHLVSGLQEIDGKTFFALADCTGHGVSGAFMTMIGFTLLNEIVIQKKLFDPAEVLEAMQKSMISFAKSQDQNHQDVMEIAFCALERISKTEVKLRFSGAKRNLFCIKNEKLEVYKGIRLSVGDSSQKKNEVHFFSQEIILQKNDSFYLFTDGFQDQNSPDNKKIGSKIIEQTISEIYHLPMTQQKQILEQILHNHQQQAEQRDDILFVGFRI